MAGSWQIGYGADQFGSARFTPAGCWSRKSVARRDLGRSECASIHPHTRPLGKSRRGAALGLESGRFSELAMSYRETEHLRILIANERQDRLAQVASIVVALGHQVIAREIEVK